MNSDMPIPPRDELEAKLTALLLGELPADEADALRRSIEQDAGLAELYERLKHTIEFVRETVATPTPEVVEPAPPLTLAADRRQELLQHFKTVRLREFSQP